MKLKPAFISLMKWNMRGVIVMMPLLLPMHIVIYCYLLDLPIPGPQLAADVVIMVLGVAVICRRLHGRTQR